MYFNYVDTTEKKNFAINFVANNYIEFFKKYKKTFKISFDKYSFFQILNYLNTKIKKNNNEKIIFHFNFLWNVKIFFLIILFKKDTKLIFSTHGMLSREALNSGIVKPIIKKIFIILYNLLIDKNVLFIAITKKEEIEIKRIFKGVKVTHIKNYVNDISRINKNINNTFVYFGRVSKYKNLLTLIKSFCRSNLNHNWKFKLYLISDDKNYLKIIKKYIIQNKLSKIIYIKKPIFDELKKYKILQSSWCSIQASYSEVLSQSNLESAINGLPFICYNIGTNDFFNKSINLKLKNIEEKEIIKKIRMVSKISKKRRLLHGKWLRRVAIANYSKFSFYEDCKQLLKNNFTNTIV